VPDATTLRRTAGRARRLARRKARAARSLAGRAVRGARRVPGAVGASTATRARNRAFLAALCADTLCGLDERELAAHRSLSLLRARVADVRAAGRLEARLVNAGLLHWTTRRLRLRRSAEAAAAEALGAGNLALADWLSSEILRSARSRPAREIQYALAVHGRDWQGAHLWRRRMLRLPATEPSPKAAAGVLRERRRVGAQRLYRLFAAEAGDATPQPRRHDGGDAAQYWALAAAAEGDEAARLGALAVAEALRAGREWHGDERRYEESFLAERIVENLAAGSRAAGNGAPHGLDRYLPLFQTFTRPTRVTTLAPAELASTVRVMNVQGLRTYLTGKSICLVANSPALIGSGLGELVDGYDLVMRFNSFVIDPEHTGARTDVHVTIHLHDYNFDVPVPVRIVLSGDQRLWIESVRRKVRPHAQEWLGDESLRWPARDLGLISPSDPFRTPTAGFNLLRLLLHLDVSSAIDLVGFDFYESGKLRLERAMHIPHSAAHNSRSERDWVLARAHRVTPTVISMLPGVQRAGAAS
jgi:hypothetical protein